MTRARGGSGSDRETTTTGRLFAASPRSASQTSPGCGFIQEIQNVLLCGSRSQEVQSILVCQFDDFYHALTDLIRSTLFPYPKLFIQPFDYGVHYALLVRSVAPGCEESNGIVPLNRCFLRVIVR